MSREKAVIVARSSESDSGSSEESSSSSRGWVRARGEGSSTGGVVMSRRAMKGLQQEWLGQAATEGHGHSQGQRRVPDSPYTCVSVVTPEQ